MRCTHEEFRDYRASVKEPSWPQFDRLVSLIVREQHKIIVRNQELLGGMRARRRARSGGGD